jgi:hypothetical protein
MLAWNKKEKIRPFIDAVKQNPAHFLIHLALAALVIYLSIKLVLDLAQ